MCAGGWGGISTCVCWGVGWDKYMCVCVCVCVCMSANQSVQLVHVPLSSWHNAVLGTQLDKVCYYSITHSSASSQGSHVSPALDRLPALPLQVWLTGLEQDGPPNSSS